MSDIMMACGCVAQGKDSHNQPVCISHIDSPKGHTVVSAPDLTGRQAKCSCNEVRPSSISLAFFKFQGEGSPDALEICKHCKYHFKAHQHDTTRVDPRSMMELGKCTGFEPHGPWDFDSYYCGHMGWD